MIKLNKLNGQNIVVNGDLVEFVEETPDCLITMTTGRKMMVRQKMDEVLERLLEYRQARTAPYPVPAGGESYEPADIKGD
jgi:flagellar protein FlbD